ncbi:MAG: TetR/AcrR family transcriptional regulator [Proteobacteria bacterium]|nr:TetR/AcrR family transcriptional regulator [Pseudomonadota bacterium]
MDPSIRREQILEHAAALFGKKGYHATSISNIVKSAGIARGTFYQYFKNKRAIFEELLDYLVVQIQNRLIPVEMPPSGPSPREQILNNIISILELFSKNRALLSILLEGAVGLDKGFAKKLAEFYEQIAYAIDGSLRRGQKMGLVRECNTRIAALAVVGALKEVLHDMLRSPEEKVDIDALASEILDVFLRGVIVDGISI